SPLPTPRPPHPPPFPTRRSSDLAGSVGCLGEAVCPAGAAAAREGRGRAAAGESEAGSGFSFARLDAGGSRVPVLSDSCRDRAAADRKSTRLNSSHVKISYAVFCL